MSDPPEQRTEEPAGDDVPTNPPQRSEAETIMGSIRALHGADTGVSLDLEDADGVGVTPQSTAPTGERYSDAAEIARGGMGAIFRVRDQELRRSLAMKVLLGSAGTLGSRAHPDQLNRFLEEARVTAQLAHPGVVPVHELGIDAEGRVFFTMSLVRGKTLSEIVALARNVEDGWTLTRAVQVILRVCETMAFAHDKGVIHRDIKPDNVMVGRFGETYVMDWGLAKVLGQEDLHDIRLKELTQSMPPRIESTRSESAPSQSTGAAGSERDQSSPIMTMDGDVLGTPAYMPPEQARGQVDDVDKRSDVYAIGALLYELLTGRPPYIEPGARVSPYVVLGAVDTGPPKPIIEIDPQAPEELVAVCEKAMARERDERYSTAEELAEDLQRFMSGHVVRAHRTGALIELRKWIKRNRAVAATVAASFVVVAGLTAWFLHSVSFERDRAVDAEETATARQREAEGARVEAEDARVETAQALVRARGVGLAAASSAAASHDHQLGLLLAREAVRTDASEVAMNRLHEAIAQSHERVQIPAGDDAVLHEATSRVFGGRPNGGIGVWSLAGEELLRLGGGEGVYLEGFTVHPDGVRVYAKYVRQGYYVWSLDGGKPERLANHGDEVESVQFSKDGRLLFSIDRAAAEIRVAAAADGTILSRAPIEVRSRGARAPIAVSPRGTHVVASDLADNVHVWPLAGGQLGEPRSCAVPGASELWMSPTGRWVACGTGYFEDPVFRVEIDTGEMLRFTEQPGIAPDVAFSPDGTLVAVADTQSDGGAVHVRDEKGGVVSVLRGHDGALSRVAFAPDGQSIATAGVDKTVRLWTRDGAPIATLRGHRDRITRLQFIEDGRALFTASRDGTARVWVCATEAGAPLLGARDAVAYVREAPDAEPIIVTGGQNDFVHRFARDGAPLSRDRVGGGRLLRVIEAEAGLIFVSHIDREIRVWRSLGAPPVALRGHKDGIVAIAYSPDGARVAAANAGGSVRVWDADVTLLATAGSGLGGGAGRYRENRARVAFLDDGEGVAVVGQFGDLGLFDIPADDAQPKDSERDPWRGWVGVTCRDLAAAPRAGVAVVATADDRLLVLTKVGEQPRRLPVEVKASRLGGMALDESGRRLAMAWRDGTVALWDLEGNELFRTQLDGVDVRRVALSPDGRTIVVGAEDGAVVLLPSDGADAVRLTGHAGRVRTLAFSPDGTLVASGAHDGQCFVSSAAGRLLTTLPTSANHLVFAVGGQRVIAGDGTGSVRIYTVDGTPVWTWQDYDVGPDSSTMLGILSMAVSPDGSRVAVGQFVGATRVFDATCPAPIATIPMRGRYLAAFDLSPRLTHVVYGNDTHAPASIVAIAGDHVPVPAGPDIPKAAAFLPDGERCVIANFRGKLQLVDLAGTTLREYEKHDEMVRSIAVCADGLRFVTGSLDRTVRLYSVEGPVLVELPGHDAEVVALAISPDGHCIATGTETGTVRIWHESGELRLTLRAHGGPVRHMTFSPDGRQLVTTTSGEPGRIWDLTPEALLSRSSQRVSRSFTDAERQRYAGLLDEQPATDRER